MEEKNNYSQEIEYLEQDLGRLEQNLEDAYNEAGKALLEVAEMESQKVNRLVDEIITIRRKLAALKIKEVTYESKSKSTQSE